MTSRPDRIAGALLGVHAGDSLGATVEFMSWAEIRRRYPDGVTDIVGGGPFGWPAGHATDDTDLTRAVLLAYFQPQDDVVRAAADHMLDWLHGNWPDREPGTPPRDIGGATRDGLQRYESTGDPRRAGAGQGRAGNGSLMRCVPTALFVADPQRRIRESMEISAITHDDPRCTIACAAYNEMVAVLVEGGTPEAATGRGEEVATSLGNSEVTDALRYGRQLRPARIVRTGETFLATDGAGFVLDSLSLAVAASLDRRPLPQVLIDIVRVGRDTDTNAAIAGGLLGARDGAAAIPANWRTKLQFAAEFTDAASRLTGPA
jgi:ADP-ribosylglycohydrolase